MAHPRISVVIPTYNRSGQILTAVESALAQEVPVHEVLVVDDGSTDDTATRFPHRDPRVRYIRKANGGASSARNAGIMAAEGDWIAFLDSDDTWETRKLGRQLDAVESTGAAVCFTFASDETGTPVDDGREMFPDVRAGGVAFSPPGDPRIFLHHRHPFITSLLVRRDVVIASGMFDPTLRVAEDTRLLYRMCWERGFAMVTESLATICRDREVSGLSDDIRAEVAAVRYECYVKVQAEFFWSLLPADPKVAAKLRSNLGYFLSRRAELECALGNLSGARSLGREAFHFGAGWRTRLRGLLAMAVPSLCQGRWKRKWKVDRND